MFLFSSLTEAFTRPRATWPWHEIHIKAEEFCEMPPTVRLCRPHPYSHAHCYHRVWELVVCFVPQHSPGWNVGLICYQSQLVFPADAHRPGVTQPHSCTSCVRICQDCSLMLFTFGFLESPKARASQWATVMQHQVDFEIPGRLALCTHGLFMVIPWALHRRMWYRTSLTLHL